MAVVTLDIDTFKAFCGESESDTLSQRDDTFITLSITRAKSKIKACYVRSDRVEEYDETEEYCSNAIMNYAVYLLYQRAEIPETAEGWKDESLGFLRAILGQNVSFNETELQVKPASYAYVATKEYDSDDMEWY